MENSNETQNFIIPLSIGWIINLLGWILFVSTFNHALELLTTVLCIGCIYVGYRHKQLGTQPFLGMQRLSSVNLIYSSAFEAIWMASWGLGFFGDF